MIKYIDVLFDAAPGPEGGKFIEVEDHTGRSIDAGEWVKRADGYHALRIYEKHIHEAKYEDGVLTRQCNRCGKDLTHPAHRAEI